MRTSTFHLHDIAFGGGLERTLREWRERGFSYDQIQHLLYTRGTKVSRTTVHRWIKDIEAAAEELPAVPAESAFDRELRLAREADAGG